MIKHIAISSISQYNYIEYAIVYLMLVQYNYIEYAIVYLMLVYHSIIILSML